MIIPVGNVYIVVDIMVEAELVKEFGIHRLVIPVPFPVEPLNVYFVEEPIPTLIDTPPRGSAFLRLLRDHLGTLGFSINEIKRIILTHPHFDHYGLAGHIVSKSKAEVWATAGTGNYFRRDNIEEEEGFQRDLLVRAGAPAEWIDYVRRKFGGWARRYGCDLTPEHFIEDATRVPIGTGDFLATSVPGHTPWCMLIHDPNGRIAFTGDFLLYNISSNPIVQRPSVIPEGYGSLKAFISSLKRVRTMELQLALPGHGRLIENPNERIDALLQFIEGRKLLVYDILQSGPQTLFHMVKKLFPHLRRYELFLAVSEVIGHLEVLEEEGRVVREEPVGGDHLIRFTGVG